MPLKGFILQSNGLSVLVALYTTGVNMEIIKIIPNGLALTMCLFKNS